MKTGKAILGVVAGVAAGAVLGILFAPQKGRDTRKKVVKKGEELADAIDQRMDQKLEAFEQQLDDVLRGFIGRISKVRNDKESVRKTEMMND